MRLFTVRHAFSEHFIGYLVNLFSAAVAYLLRGLTCSVFKDALLHTTIVMHGYLH